MMTMMMCSCAVDDLPDLIVALQANRLTDCKLFSQMSVIKRTGRSAAVTEILVGCATVMSWV